MIIINSLCNDVEMNTHESVLNVFQKLGYTKTDGICHGVSLRWLESKLLKEEYEFNERIGYIPSTNEFSGFMLD